MSDRENNTALKCFPQQVVIVTLVSDAGFRIPTLNNRNTNMKEKESTGCPEKPPRSYDLWQSDSLFPCWNDLNGLVPENITPPHPSELPLPSAKLASPIQKMQQSDSGYRNEVEATSTMGDNVSGDNFKPIKTDENKNKSKE